MMTIETIKEMLKEVIVKIAFIVLQFIPMLVHIIIILKNQYTQLNNLTKDHPFLSNQPLIPLVRHFSTKLNP
jgi:hypothetical protein